MRQTTTPAPDKRWRLAPPSCSSVPAAANAPRVAHVVPGGRDPAVGVLDVRDAELVDMAVERIGDAAQRAGRCQGQLGKPQSYLLIDKRFNPNSAKCAPPACRAFQNTDLVFAFFLSEPRLWRRVVAHASTRPWPPAPLLGPPHDRRRAPVQGGPSDPIGGGELPELLQDLLDLTGAGAASISRHSALPPAPDTDRPARGKADGGDSFAGGPGERRRADLAT